MEQARAFLAAGRTGEAEAAALARLAAVPADAAALHLLALVRHQAGRARECEELLVQAVNAAPDFLPAQVDLGALLVGLGRGAEAVLCLENAVSLSPGNVEAHLNLGNALHSVGRMQSAEHHYRDALDLDPGNVRARLSLGNLLCDVRRLPESVEQLAEAVRLAPDMAVAHQCLANALRDMGRVEEAEASYRRAIELEPSIPVANENLGHLLKAGGRLEEAQQYLMAAGTPYARALALECLLRLGRHEEFFADLAAHRSRDQTNLHAASLSAYAAAQFGVPDPHPFCPDPLRYMRLVDEVARSPDRDQFLDALAREAGSIEAVWEPRGVSTKLGYQTGGNLFTSGKPALARLHDLVMAAMARYRDEIQPRDISLVTRWPARPRLHGWFVRLLTGGHQDFHNHPYGWMSGVIYLRIPGSSPPPEGAIEFGLKSRAYPDLPGPPAPTLLHHPKPGQMCLFPSSLYHRTVPFTSAEERLCIAFDLLPA